MPLSSVSYLAPGKRRSYSGAVVPLLDGTKLGSNFRGMHRLLAFFTDFRCQYFDGIFDGAAGGFRWSSLARSEPVAISRLSNHPHPNDRRQPFRIRFGSLEPNRRTRLEFVAHSCVAGPLDSGIGHSFDRYLSVSVLADQLVSEPALRHLYGP